MVTSPADGTEAAPIEANVAVRLNFYYVLNFGSYVSIWASLMQNNIEKSNKSWQQSLQYQFFSKWSQTQGLIA